MEEVWSPIRGFSELYQVSNTGKVRHKKHGLKKLQVGEHGYLWVPLWDGKKYLHKRVHRIVAEAFIPNPNGYKEVNHIDEDKTNNSALNLEWCSRKQNIEHSILSGKYVVRPVSQYSTEGFFIASYSSASEAERATGVPRTHICKCAKGRYGFKSAGGFIWKYTCNEDPSE